MKQVLLLFVFTCLLSAASAYADGRGGKGRAGHSSSGGAHASGGRAHSGASVSHSSGAHTGTGHTAAGHTGGSNTGRTHSGSTHPGGIRSGGSGNQAGIRTVGEPRANTRPVMLRTTTPRAIAASHTPNVLLHTRAGFIVRHTINIPRDPAYSGPYVPVPYYYANSCFYNPFISIWSFGLEFMYTPNYYPSSAPVYIGKPAADELPQETMDGFVVFYNDTFSGEMTIEKRAINLETIDSGRNLNYVFHTKNLGVQYVKAYNEDNRELTLVKLKGDTKKLWRIIHEGALSIYDRRRDFIYKPEDIDLKTLTVVYNGKTESLNSTSVNEAKEWLTGYVNQAYAMRLDPQVFSWKELLIYIDKLD